MTNSWRGVYVILPTPFDKNNEVDEKGLREIIRFSLASGVHGVVAPANASEFAYLSDQERNKLTKIVVNEVAGRVPVVIGVTAVYAGSAVALAKHAQDCGADMVMAMPPHVQRASGDEIYDYYKAIDRAISIPIVLQNYGGPGGTPMTAPFMARLLKDLLNAQYVKEETEFSSPLITAIQQQAGETLKGVMGGKAGRQLLDEHRRGACGTMPACEVADIHVKLWNALEADDQAEARSLYRDLLPLLLFETTYGVAVYKEVLKRRGVLTHAHHRQVGGKHLDEFALAELDAILSDLQPLMTTYQPLV